MLANSLATSTAQSSTSLSQSQSQLTTTKVHNTTGQPMWGCGLLGAIPGIQSNGTTSPEAQKLIDELKKTSSFDKVSYWNWNLAPMKNDDGSMQYLSKDFLFMPENWGVSTVNASWVRPANEANFPDSQGNPSPATMADIFLGANEPDIIGSCMGNMMGACTGSCTPAEVATGCPEAHLHDPTPAQALPNGHCNCWSDSHATGMGFWPVQGCSNPQPLPDLFKDQACVDIVMGLWRETAALAASKGYKYLSTPLVAVNIDWLKDFVTAACDGCSEVSCGCPTHVGWHFYANDCRPKETGGYKNFQAKLDATTALMEEFEFLQGAIINEVGMLNCDMATPSSSCIPNGPTQKYPASNQPDHACPKTKELPDGLGSFIKHLLHKVMRAKTKDGRSTVAGFSWFNENMVGGTYNLRFFNDDGTLNSVGEAYISSCKKWAKSLGL